MFFYKKKLYAYQKEGAIDVKTFFRILYLPTKTHEISTLKLTIQLNPKGKTELES